MTVLDIVDFNEINKFLTDNMSQYAEGPAIDNVVKTILKKTTELAMLLGICFYLIMLGFNYLKSGIDKFTNPNSEFFIDLNELTRSIGLLTLIALFPTIMTVVVGFVNVSYKMTKLSKADYETMEGQNTAINHMYAGYIKYPEYTKALNQIAKCNSGEQSGLPCYYWQQVKTEWEQSGKKNTDKTKTVPATVTTKPAETPPMTGGIISDAISSAITELIGMLMLSLITCAKMIIFAITKIWLKVLYVVGPLALAFSIIPFFRRQGEIWFGYFLNTCFVFVTFNILDCIFFGFLTLKRAAVYQTQETSVVTYYFVLLIAYFSAFRITSYYVGKGEAGRAVGKAVGTLADAGRLAFTAGVASKTGGNIAGKIAGEMAKGNEGIKGK